MKNKDTLIKDVFAIMGRADGFETLAIIPGMYMGVDMTSSYDGFIVIIEYRDTKELRKILISPSLFEDYEAFRQYVFEQTRPK